MRPLGRAAEVAERAGGAALAAVTSAVVLGALPAYPQSWTLPLVAVTAAVWAVVPEAGLAFLLGSLAFPLFNVSLSLGGAYLAFAVALFLVARAQARSSRSGRRSRWCSRRPISRCWRRRRRRCWAACAARSPPPGPASAPSSSCCSRGRRAARSRWSSRAGASAMALAAAGDPFTAAGRVLAHAIAAPTLLQAAVWAGLAASLGYALTRRRLETRLWIWSLSFAAVFALYRIVPVVVWDYPASLWPLVWSVAVPAAVILLPLVLTTGEAPEEGDDGDLQEGE